MDDATETKSFRKVWNVFLGTVNNVEVQHQKFDTNNTLVSQDQSLTRVQSSHFSQLNAEKEASKPNQVML